MAVTGWVHMWPESRAIPIHAREKWQAVFGRKLSLVFRINACATSKGVFVEGRQPFQGYLIEATFIHFIEATIVHFIEATIIHFIEATIVYLIDPYLDLTLRQLRQILRLRHL
jgi:hypothetical protein